MPSASTAHRRNEFCEAGEVQADINDRDGKEHQKASTQHAGLGQAVKILQDVP